MTKKKLDREIKDAAAPAIEVVRLLVEQMREQGQATPRSSLHSIGLSATIPPIRKSIVRRLV